MENLLPSLPKKTEQRPEILRRLIENYFQKSLLASFEENRSFDLAWKKWDEGGRKGPEPALILSGSKSWLTKVIQRAQTMITDYPTHRRLDEAYFQNAYALDILGQHRQSTSYYELLLRRFPNSKRVPEAYYAIGEYYFDNNDFRKALQYYLQVDRFPLSNMHIWAVHKSAWCNYNLQKYKESLDKFKQVVSLSSTSNSASPTAKSRIKSQALQEMVLVFASIGDLSAAENYYMTVGGEKYYSSMLLKLGDLLRERGQFAESMRVLKMYVARKPLDFKAVETQIQIVDVASILQDKTQAWAEMKFLLSNFREGTPWAQKNLSDEKYHDVLKRIEKVALYLPQKLHAEGQKENNKYKYAQAEVGYNLFLTYFPNSPKAVELRFLLGEIQYQNNRFAQAVKTFEPIFQMKEKTPFFQKVGEYILSASFIPIENQMKLIKNKTVKPGLTPVTIPENMLAYVKACDQHVLLFPKDTKNKLSCDLDTAEIYLRHFQYPEAEKRLFILAKNYPSEVFGKKSAEMLLFLAAQDKKKLLQTAEKISTISQYNQGDLGKRLVTIKQQNQLVEAAEIEKSGDFLKAAQRFEAVAVANSNAADADKAWFNAGVNYRKSQQIEKSIAAFSKVFNNYPKSPQSVEALLLIIEMTSERLQIEPTARYSLLFLQRYPKDKRRDVIALETCYLFDALNDIAKVNEVCTPIMNSKSTSAMAAGDVLADIYERNGKFSDLIKVIDGFLLRQKNSINQKIIYINRAAQAEFQLGKSNNVKRRNIEISNLYLSNGKLVQGAALSAVAHIEFEKQTGILQRYQKLKIQAQNKNGADLQQSIKAKTTALQQLEGAFKKIIALGDAEWGVASLFVIGSAYERFSQDLKNPPIPPGASPEETKKIQATLGNIGKGLSEKAKVFYAEGMEAASKFAVYTDYTKNISQSLAKMNDNEYRSPDDWIPQNVYVGNEWIDTQFTQDVLQQMTGGKK